MKVQILADERRTGERGDPVEIYDPSISKRHANLFSENPFDELEEMYCLLKPHIAKDIE